MDAKNATPSHLVGIGHGSPKLEPRESARTGWTYVRLYKKFWNELGPLLLRVTNTSMQTGKLPTSMLNGIITLIPKKRPYITVQLETHNTTEY
jgi:hypothetical protein